MPRVVIIGGSFAGNRVRALLPSSWEVLVVDARPYWEFTPGMLRCWVEPGVAGNLVRPHGAGVIVAQAEAIHGGAGHVVCKDGRHVPFDYLVLCTGSNYASLIKPSPTSQAGRSERLAEVAAAAKQLASASSVLVVGGGPVGVELAAEIAGKFGRRKRITLLCSAPRLLDRMPAAAGAYAQQWLKARGVTVLVSSRVAEFSQDHSSIQSVVTESGEVLSADLVFDCTGCSVSGQQLFTALTTVAADTTARWNGAPVNQHLQVLGCSNVFACGDAAHTVPAVTKTAYTAELMASIVAQNLVRLQQGCQLLRFPQDLPHLLAMDRPPDVAVVSLSKYDGIYQLNSLILTGAIAVVSKWAIQFLQLKVASGSWFWLQVWLLAETAMTWVGSFAFRRG